MTAHRLLFLYLWFAPHVLQVALAVMMLRRKLAREFPAFFLYTVFEVLQFVLLVVLSKMDAVSASQYATAWVAGGTVSIAFRFAVVHEIFRHVFRTYPSLDEFGGLLFRWATAVLMVMAVALVAYTAGDNLDRVNVAIGVVDRAVSIVQCGLLVLLLLLSRFFGCSWRNYVFGIALGLGFFASVQLGTSAIQAQIGVAAAVDLFNYISMGVYHCCVLFWIVTLWWPAQVETRVSEVPTHNLDHWNAALQRLLH